MDDTEKGGVNGCGGLRGKLAGEDAYAASVPGRRGQKSAFAGAVAVLISGRQFST